MKKFLIWILKSPLMCECVWVFEWNIFRIYYVSFLQYFQWIYIIMKLWILNLRKIYFIIKVENELIQEWLWLLCFKLFLICNSVGFFYEMKIIISWQCCNHEDLWIMEVPFKKHIVKNLVLYIKDFMQNYIFKPTSKKLFCTWFVKKAFKMYFIYYKNILGVLGKSVFWKGNSL